MVSQATQPISKAGVAFFSSLCVTTFGLGCWQSQRYFEKIELVQKRNDELTLQPSSLEKDAMCSLQERIDSLSQNGKNGKVLQAAHDGNDDDIVRGFRPLKVKGKFMHEYEILVGPRGPPPGAISSSGPNSGRSSGGMSSSPQGYFIITPLSRCDNMGTVLVNRGWVPRQYVMQNINWSRPMETVDVTCVASKTEQPKFLSPPHDERKPKELLWLDRKAIEAKTNTVGLSPLLLTETSPPEDNESDFPVKPSKETVGEFKVLPSTHAGYAFTWFGLTGAGLVMTRKLITRGR